MNNNESYFQKRELSNQWENLTKKANKLAENNQYSKAIYFHQQALYIGQQLWTKYQIPNLVANLNNLGNLYSDTGQYQEAESSHLQALEIQQQLFNGDHPGLVLSLNNLGFFYSEQGKYQKAEYYYQEALDMCQRIFRGDHLDVARSLNNLGSLYSKQGKYKQALSFSHKALEMHQRLFPGDHPGVAISLNNLGSRYSEQGMYEDATSYCQQSLEMFQRIFRGDHPYLADSLNSLGFLYSKQGMYLKAESHYKQALDIRKKIFTGDHPYVATSLNNLGCSYLEQGKYEETVSCFQQALEITQRFFKGDNPNIASILISLGSLYLTLEMHEECKECYQKALEIRTKIFRDDHDSLVDNFNKLGTSYIEQKEYMSANYFIQKALEMGRRMFQREHPYIALSLNKLGDIYSYKKQYEEALNHYQQALAIQQRIFLDVHPSIVQTYIRIGIVFTAINNHKEALIYFQAAVEMENKILSRILAASNEKDRLRYLNQIRATLNYYLSLVNKYFQNNSKIFKIILSLVIQRKAINIAAITALNAAIYSGRYPHLESEFQQLQSLSNQIIRLTINKNEIQLENSEQKLSVEIVNQRLTKAQKEYEELEKLLAAQVPEIQLKDDINYEAIASELPENATLVEFVRFRTFDFERRESREERYLAFVVPSQKPEQIVMVDLGEAEAIDILIKRFRNFLTSSNADLDSMVGYSRRKKSNKKSSKDKPSFVPSIQLKTYNSQASPAQELTKILYKPLHNYLEDTKHLIIAPDSVLSLLPFELLPREENLDTYLIDYYQSIRYITTARDLLRHKKPPLRSAGTPLVLADPDYDLCLSVPNSEPNLVYQQLPPSVVNSILKTNSQPSFASPTTKQLPKRMAEMKFDKFKQLDRLNATASLGKTIANRLQVKPYLGQEAVEPLIRNSKCPRILLLATHGVYLPNDEPVEEAETLIDDFNSWRRIQVSNPMMRSLLAFAGANSWITEVQIPETAGKGWLFAQDVSRLDLWANEMTILLACETGLGDLITGEGVFGLRSSFASAGAKTVIMSLWSIPEKASVLLMGQFFNYLDQGFDKSSALKQAQNYVRNVTVAELRQSEAGMKVLRELTNFDSLTPDREIQNSSDTKPLAHPIYWGAWICQG